MGPQETLVRYPTSGVWGPQRRNPPPPPLQPSASLRTCVVLASCLRHACYEGKTTRAPPPPPTNTTAPPRVGDDGSGTRTPPRGQSGTMERQRREGAGRTTRPCPKGARTVHAPTGGPPGVRPQGRKGDDGSHTASPPPTCRGTSAAPRACTVLATCLRQRTGSKDAPPPTPFSSTHPRKGRGQRGDSEGTWGGAEDRPKRRGERPVASGGDAKKKKQRTPTRQSRDRQQGLTGHGRSQEARQGARERGAALGKKAGRRDQHRSEQGGGGVTRARKRRW